MKKNVFKTMVAAACVVAAVMGGMKTYNAGGLSETSMLLSENVEALSGGEPGTIIACIAAPGYVCYHDGYILINYRDVWL